MARYLVEGLDGGDANSEIAGEQEQVKDFLELRICFRIKINDFCSHDIKNSYKFASPVVAIDKVVLLHANAFQQLSMILLAEFRLLR